MIGRVHLLVSASAILTMATPSTVLAFPGLPPASVPLIPGARQVHVRDPDGGLSTFTSIPGGSVFATEGGGPAAECDGVAEGDDLATLDVIESVHPIRSTRWIFLEIPIPPGGILTSPSDLSVDVPVAGAPLAVKMRTFFEYCSDTSNSFNYLKAVVVPPSDPFLDPHPRLTNLYNSLQLAPLSLFENPVVGQWGGLVVRSPAWLGINPSGWVTQRSNIEVWRGWQLALFARPKALDFDVDFTPDPGRPSPAFHGVVACLGDGVVAARSGGGSMPAKPVDLAEFAEPGVRACQWTPPGPGTVTITARETFEITFWASGAVEAQPDYLWSSTPETFRVGELVAVNVNE
ncbi:MAG: hypothetical protein ABI862_15460 [Ilumatobacteraceae bacterium]